MCLSMGVQPKSFLLGSILVAFLAPWHKDEGDCSSGGEEEGVHVVKPSQDSKKLFTKQSPLLFIAGVTNSMIDSAVAAFILEVVARHGEPADVICAKEPFLMTQAGFLATAINNSKVVHMVRDGRAISHSLVSRGLEFPPFSPTNHSQNLRSWANLATGMERICRAIGPLRCRTVQYEQLVQVLRSLLSWL